MKIQVLMENTAGIPGIRTEHGLSLYVEAQGRRLLFDTGQSDAFAQNAQDMGVDLSTVDLAVLSHGHYDHGGGLHRFLQLNHHAPVYVSRHAFEEHWHGEKRDIGIDPALAQHPQIVMVGEQRSLGLGMELVSPQGRACPYELDSAGLTMRREGRLVPEDFRHEQYLLLREKGKNVVFSGCSHRGILNIQTWFQPDVLIGGFHLAGCDPEGPGREALEQTAERLAQFPTRYWTCHCTGVRLYQLLKQRMGGQLEYLAAGQTLEL